MKTRYSSLRQFPLILCPAALLLATQCSTAADPEWKAGVAVVSITPEKPLVMAGYAGRVKPFERIEHPIFAKALALQDTAGHRAVLITMDLVGLAASVASPVCERIQQKTGLKREDILLSWSHTHSAPSLSLKVTPVPGGAAADAENTVEYTRGLTDRLVQVAVDALGKLEPASLSWGVGVVTFPMNRREFTPTGVILGVNPRGPVDRSVPVLRVEDSQGKPRAVVFGTACHNTTLTQTNFSLAGDYAGFAQLYLQEKHAGLVTLFMAGCGGDANPYPRGTLALARLHGEELGGEVSRVLATRLRPISGPLRTVHGHAELPLQTPAREELKRLAEKSPSWQIGNARAMLAMVERGESLPTSFRAPVGVWQFGAHLTLVALSGEVVVDYALLIEKSLGPLQLWIAAYCNESFGYLPSARVIQEGGYENRGLGGSGWFAPEAQEALVNRVSDLARQAGRP